MFNELIFLLQTVVIAGIVLGALRLGKEALIGTIALLFVLANLFVVKQITLFGFHVTAADTYIIGAALGFNLLQEFHGRDITRKAIWIAFYTSFVSVVLSQLHMSYIPNAFDFANHSFNVVLGMLPRIVIASLIAHLVSQYVQLNLFRGLKKVFNKRYFLYRNIVAVVGGQIIDTVLFGLFGLYGIVHSITDVLLISFLIKVIVIACMTPWIMLSKKIIKNV